MVENELFKIIYAYENFFRSEGTQKIDLRDLKILKEQYDTLQDMIYNLSDLNYHDTNY
jgi:uncharacterized protein (DUF608 family)